MNSKIRRVKNWRGEELYIYPPDSYLKPILVLSKTRGEFAITFQYSLNHFSLLQDGLKHEWIRINDYKLFNEWKRKLQSKNSWNFYLDIYFKHFKKDGIK